MGSRSDIGRREQDVGFKGLIGVRIIVRVITYIYVLSHQLITKIILRCSLVEGKGNSMKCLIELKQVKKGKNVETSN